VRFLDNPTVGGFPGENGVVRYGEGLLIGYRWYDTRELAVAYPFGHGLSYTSFAYTDATAVPAADGSARVEVSVTVRNTGDRAGREVVQVYVADPTSRVFRPAQELRGFASVDLDAGESQGVTIDLGPRAFAYWDTAPSRWVVEGGTFEIRVGASSRDIRCSVTVELTGDDLARPLGATSPAEDWLAHPEAGPALLERLGGLAAVVNDVHLGPLVRPTPLIRLTRLPGSALTESDVAALEARYGRTH
jgi:beta-glucosidase